jgi:hypothetical protein
MANFRVEITSEGRTFSVEVEVPEGANRQAAAHFALQELIAAQQQPDSRIPAEINFHPNDADRATVTELD